LPSISSHPEPSSQGRKARACSSGSTEMTEAPPRLRGGNRRADRPGISVEAPFENKQIIGRCAANTVRGAGPGGQVCNAGTLRGGEGGGEIVGSQAAHRAPCARFPSRRLRIGRPTPAGPRPLAGSVGARPLARGDGASRCRRSRQSPTSSFFSSMHAAASSLPIDIRYYASRGGCDAAEGCRRSISRPGGVGGSP